MRVGIIGAGRIGGNAARLFAGAGHDVMVSFSRDRQKLERLAAEIGGRSGTPAEAAAFGEAVMLSVPWRVIDEALAAAGPLAGKIVIDTTNHFGGHGTDDPARLTGAQLNQARIPEAKLVKAFNTLTAGFQASAAGRAGADRVVMFLCGDDDDAKQVTATLINDAGFVPIDLGNLKDAAPMEAPRRPGAVYGEEYHREEAIRFVEGLRGTRD